MTNQKPYLVGYTIIRKSSNVLLSIKKESYPVLEAQLNDKDVLFVKIRGILVNKYDILEVRKSYKK